MCRTVDMYYVVVELGLKVLFFMLQIINHISIESYSRDSKIDFLKNQLKN